MWKKLREKVKKGAFHDTSDDNEKRKYSTRKSIFNKPKRCRVMTTEDLFAYEEKYGGTEFSQHFPGKPDEIREPDKFEVNLTESEESDNFSDDGNNSFSKVITELFQKVISDEEARNCIQLENAEKCPSSLTTPDAENSVLAVSIAEITKHFISCEREQLLLENRNNLFKSSAMGSSPSKAKSEEMKMFRFKNLKNIERCTSVDEHSNSVHVSEEKIECPGSKTNSENVNVKAKG